LLHSSRPKNKASLWRPKKWLSRRISLRSGYPRLQHPPKSVDMKWRIEEV
jgi:hypothetical protein